MMQIEDMLQLFDVVLDEEAQHEPDVVDEVDTASREDDTPLLESEFDPNDIQEVLRLISGDVLDTFQNIDDDDLAREKRHKRRSTELERLKRYGWERVEDKATTNKRIRFSYVNRSGQTCTSLKQAMSYCRDVDASA